ncbi:MAG: hypothetical protein NC938_02800 [Candidatus Omnitrophica bacterium]|nr:hypothetical protein [Candidatus Omnitrophota bacterium]
MKKGEKGDVYIVHCVDTEGPLYEDSDATLQRLVEALSIDKITANDIVRRIQHGGALLSETEKAVNEFVKKDLLIYNDTWDKIYRMHETLFSAEFRLQFPDSKDRDYCFSWFCIDHVNFKNNPRRRTLGIHAIYREYRDLLDRHPNVRDRIYWHYHPRSFSGDAHRTGSNYSFSNLHNEIIARRIIDYMWFPAAHRPTVTEHMDASVWLEQWIPFDFGNLNMEHNPGLEMLERLGRVPGRFADWRGAPTDWIAYHPSLRDCRKPGEMKRYIARCLNLNCRHSTITPEELEKAFLAAENGQNSLVAVTNHDFRDMVAETSKFIDMVRKISRKHPSIKFYWSNAVEAFRAYLGMKKMSPPKIRCRLDKNLLRIDSDIAIWGPQPFLAIRTKEGNYYHDNLIINSDRDWSYVFDSESFMLDMVSHIGVATNDAVGNVVVVVCNLARPAEWRTREHNLSDWLEV